MLLKVLMPKFLTKITWFSLLLTFVILKLDLKEDSLIAYLGIAAAFVLFFGLISLWFKAFANLISNRQRSGKTFLLVMLFVFPFISGLIYWIFIEKSS